MAYRQGVSGIAACLPPSPPPPENDRPGPAGPALTRRPRTTASPALPVPSWSCLPRRALPSPRAGPTPLPPSGAREKCYCRANPCPRRMCSKPARTGAAKERGNRCAARPGRRPPQTPPCAAPSARNPPRRPLRRATPPRPPSTAPGRRRPRQAPDHAARTHPAAHSRVPLRGPFLPRLLLPHFTAHVPNIRARATIANRGGCRPYTDRIGASSGGARHT